MTITGGSGFLGRRMTSLVLERRPREVFTFTSADYDLTRQAEVTRMYMDQRPDVVIHLAARVGGIGANRDNAGRFFYENAIMGIELIEQGFRHGVKKFVQIGTVCSYPNLTPVPFSEESLWDGYPEETNASYGIAKKALLVQGQAYRLQYGFNVIHVLPANLYGPGDNFDPHSSHVIPALIRKCLEAKATGEEVITVWGSGMPTREFLYVDDAARGLLLATERYNKAEPVNLGTSREVSIKKLVGMIVRLVGYSGEVRWDRKQPDGQPRRKLRVDRAAEEFGFRAEVGLEDGLRRTIGWYLDVASHAAPGGATLAAEPSSSG